MKELRPIFIIFFWLGMYPGTLHVITFVQEVSKAHMLSPELVAFTALYLCAIIAWCSSLMATFFVWCILVIATGSHQQACATLGEVNTIAPIHTIAQNIQPLGMLMLISGHTIRSN